MAQSGRIRHLWLFYLAADFYAVAAAYYTGLLLRFHSHWGVQFFTWVNQFLGVRETGAIGEGLENFYYASAFRIVVLLTVTLCLLYALRDLYPGMRFILRRPVGWNILVANVLALAIFYTYFYLQRNVFHPRSFFATVIFLNIIYCAVLRGLVSHLLQYVRSRYRIGHRSAVLFGDTEEGRLIAGVISGIHPHGIDLMAQVPAGRETPFDQRLSAIRQAMQEYRADLLICAEKNLSVAEIMQVLELADELDWTVKVLSPELNVLVDQARLPVDLVHGIPLAHFEAPSDSARFAAARHAMSLLFALTTLIVALPLIGLLTLLIRITSRGPAFFTQERIGVNRKPFRMLKFRTMYDRSEELQAEIEEFNESGGGLFKIRRESRITPVGRFLRRFSLDELPQLINVIRGEMNLVGPRPLPRRDFENYYEEWHYSRHSGMPGLTCLWQVSGRSDIDFHNMCILDVYYLRNQNWMLDLKIILKTFWAVLFAKGAY